MPEVTPFHRDMIPKSDVVCKKTRFQGDEMRKHLLFALVCLLCSGASAAALAEEITPQPYYSQPAISHDGSTIAFVHGGDIYLVPREGGDARLLISHEAFDSTPSFSPDGKWLAFSSGRNGSTNVYAANLEEGEVRQLTWHSSTDRVECWSPDSQYIYFSSGRSDINGMADLYRVSIDGGEPVMISRDRYEPEYNATVSPDGTRIAFNVNDHLRQWWRHGERIDNATEIWIKPAEPGAGGYERFTTYEGKDSWPMWAPDGQGMYFVTDRGPNTGVENLAYKPLNGEASLLTSFSSGRVLWPDMAADGTIVFEREFGIWLLPKDGQAAQVPINTFSDTRSNPVDVRTLRSGVTEFSYSPDGKKLAYVIRGDVFVAPAKPDKDEGTPLAFQVTDTAARERSISWGKESNVLYYESQRGESADIYSFDFISREEQKLVASSGNDTFPSVSPDGKYMVFQRGTSDLMLYDIASGTESRIAEFLQVSSYSWSKDGSWLFYSGSDSMFFTNVFAKKMGEESEALQLTYLPHLWTYNIHVADNNEFIAFSTQQNRLEGMIMRVNLKPLEGDFSEDSFDKLFTPPKKEKEEKPAEKTGESEDSAEKKEDSGKKEDAEGLTIVMEHIKERISRLVPFTRSANVVGISPDSEKILFVSTPKDKSVLWMADAEDGGNVKQIAEGRGFGNVQFAKDGKTFHYISSGRIFTASIAGGSPKPVAVMAEKAVDFNAEKLAAFREAWNMMRDSHFDETMNGLDWEVVFDRYAPYMLGAKNMTEWALIGNLFQGDLNASHMGIYAGGDEQGPPSGMLGLDFDQRELSGKGHFKISRIIDGGPVDIDEENVSAGEYLVSVKGTKLDGSTNLAKLLKGTIGKRVEIGVAATPDAEEVKTLKVKPVSTGGEIGLRYRQWVRDNREYVSKISDGDFGYVHIPNMGTNSFNQFRLDLDAEIHGKKGVVIDIRNNNGGWIASFAIDILARKVTHYQTFRDRGKVPSSRFVGNYLLDKPMVLVQNEQSLSNAENFSEAWRQLKLGPIVGTNTCGWLVFTSGQGLVNGAFIRKPSWKNLTLEGVDMDKVSRKPDIYVDRPVGESLSGKDSQLDKAVEVLREQLAR